MSMLRIIGRDPPPPKFESIRSNIIETHNFGWEGAPTAEVIRTVTAEYRLRHKEVDETSARHAINAGRPVVCTFGLFANQWTAFSSYFRDNKSGVLESKHLTNPGGNKGKVGGHAVVLVGFGRGYMKFMNSWGKDWADGGFFKVRDGTVLGSAPSTRKIRYFDIFWYASDLSAKEQAAYRKFAAEELGLASKKISPAFKNLIYKCPKCGQCSPLNDYVGDVFLATCPKCRKSFKPKSIGEEFKTNLFVRTARDHQVKLFR